jgi:DNA mismatch repair protein MutS2
MAPSWRTIENGYRCIDLHGMDRTSASTAVRDALAACRRDGVRRLRIIHGKGTGVLRDEVRFLLDGSADVADVRTAKPRDGGEGAVEVWLEGGSRRGPIR